MATIADMHLSGEQTLCIVMANPSAVEVYCDVDKLPAELAFGLKERCDVFPLNADEHMYCVSAVDDSAVNCVFDMVRAMFASVLKHARLTEPPVYFIQPDDESNGMQVSMIMSPVGRKPKTYDVVAPDATAINHACISTRWQQGRVEIPFYGPTRSTHATQQSLGALWDRVATASEAVMSRVQAQPATH